MNKNEFLNQSNNFIQWLACRLDAPLSFNHRWVSRHSPIGIKKGEEWTCESLFSAHEGYVWKAKNIRSNADIQKFTETADYLDLISSDLTQALNAPPFNNSEILSLCEEVLKWGKVDKPTIAKTLRNMGTDLGQYLFEVKNYFNNVDDLAEEDFFLDVNGSSYPIELDSGTTKIYSLICDNFVMYDSRVGAALAKLVMDWAESHSTRVPAHLAFPWGKAQTETSKLSSRRNPDPVRNSIFLELNSQKKGVDKRHHRIKFNVYANWLLAELTSRKSRFDQVIPKHRKLRAIESALFMIGYTINDETADRVQKQKISKTVKTTHLTPIATDEIRREVLKYLKENCTGVNNIKFTSSDIRATLTNLKNRQADLTTVCQAINKVSWFEKHGFKVEIIDAPKSKLGRVTYRTARLSS